MEATRDSWASVIGRMGVKTDISTEQRPGRYLERQGSVFCQYGSTNRLIICGENDPEEREKLVKGNSGLGVCLAACL